MRIDDLRRTFDVQPSVVESVGMVEERTGKPIEFRVDKDATSPAIVKIARNRMGYHLIKLHPGVSGVVSYLIANKAANILRMWKLHSEDRKVVASTDQTLRAAREAIEGNAGSTASPMPDQTIDYLVSGVVNQLANLPIQIRIERYVHATLPDVRAEQSSYLDGDVRQTIAGMSDDVERMVPRMIFETSGAMTYAYVRGIGELLDTNFTQPYNNYPSISRKGKELYSMVGLDDDGSHSSDVKLIDEWAAALGMSEWFVWQDFETMPESYYDDVTS